jgi:hypothetical protein
MFKLAGVFTILLIFAFMSCAGAPAGSSGSREAEAVAAAAAASASMDRIQSGQPASAGTAPQTSQAGVKTASGGKEPSWVSSPGTDCMGSAYLAGVGFGSSRQAAEKDAFRALASFFGMSVQSEETNRSTYNEAVRNGAVSSWSKNDSMEQMIKTSVEMESLVGAEIKDVWFDGKTSYHAAAVLEKAKTVTLYLDLIQSNQRIIDDLITMDDAEKNSLDGYSRYQLAGIIADANGDFAKVLTMVGGAAPANLRRGDEYRQDAAKITQAIPITISVDNDRSGRIRGAFASVINKAGFRSGGSNARYVLDISVVLNPMEYPNQTNKFVEYVIDAKLIDLKGVKDPKDGVVLFSPDNIRGREGHTTIPLAETRAIGVAVKKIEESYGALLAEYLSQKTLEKR